MKNVNSSRSKSQPDTQKYAVRPSAPACLDAGAAILISTSDLYHFSFCHHFCVADMQPVSRVDHFSTGHYIDYTQIMQNWKEWGHNLFYFGEKLLLPQFTSLMLSWLTARIVTEERKDYSIPNWFLKYPVDLI